MSERRLSLRRCCSVQFVRLPVRLCVCALVCCALSATDPCRARSSSSRAVCRPRPSRGRRKRRQPAPTSLQCRVRLSVCLSACSSVCLSVCLFVCRLLPVMLVDLLYTGGDYAQLIGLRKAHYDDCRQFGLLKNKW